MASLIIVCFLVCRVHECPYGTVDTSPLARGPERSTHPRCLGRGHASAVGGRSHRGQLVGPQTERGQM